MSFFVNPLLLLVGYFWIQTIGIKECVMVIKHMRLGEYESTFQKFTNHIINIIFKKLGQMKGNLVLWAH
jgi:hypothetical protein